MGVQIANSQGVLMNNFFPALVSGMSPDVTDDGNYAPPSQKNQRYPKFGLENITASAQGGNPNMVVQD